MKELNLGHVIPDDAEQQRDAIHIAVAPVVAGINLTAGEHVGLMDSGTATTNVEPIGVVDPFLKEPVVAGERFWLFLYPNTITSLRHEWAHPAFKEVPKPSTQEEDARVVASENWLRNFASSVDADYDEMMAVAESHCRDSSWGDYLIDGGKWEGQGTPKEFWDHFKVVTGKEPRDGHKPGIFSCSC